MNSSRNRIFVWRAERSVTLSLETILSFRLTALGDWPWTLPTANMVVTNGE